MGRTASGSCLDDSAPVRHSPAVRKPRCGGGPPAFPTSGRLAHHFVQGPSATVDYLATPVGQGAASLGWALQCRRALKRLAHCRRARDAARSRAPEEDGLERCSCYLSGPSGCWQLRPPRERPCVPTVPRVLDRHPQMTDRGSGRPADGTHGTGGTQAEAFGGVRIQFESGSRHPSEHVATWFAARHERFRERVVERAYPVGQVTVGCGFLCEALANPLCDTASSPVKLTGRRHVSSRGSPASAS